MRYMRHFAVCFLYHEMLMLYNYVMDKILIMGATSYFAARHMLTDAITHGIFADFGVVFHMIISGDPTKMIIGIIIGVGLTSMIVRGLWKMMISTFTHEVFSLIFRGISGLIGLFFRRSVL